MDIEWPLYSSQQCAGQWGKRKAQEETKGSKEMKRRETKGETLDWAFTMVSID